VGDLSPNFSKSEFACKCGCGSAGVSVDLILRLQEVREILTYRFHLLGAIFRSGLFGRVGIAEHYVHVDIDADKPQEVAWVYP
jgi:hypothetical protein